MDLQNKAAFFDELSKIGAISDEQARQSLDRLDTLERNKPTVSQVGRYAGMGAVAGPMIGAVGNALRGGRLPGTSLIGHLAGAGAGGIPRAVAGSAATGAISSGLVPLVRNQLDRRAEIGTLKSFVKERELPPAAPGPAGTEVSGKIAAAIMQTPEPPEEKYMRRAGLGAVSGAGAVVGNGFLNDYVRHQAVTEHAGDADVMSKMRRGASVPVYDAPPGVNSFLPPELSPDIGPKGAVLLGKDTRNPSILAHELGHADIQGSKSGRLVQNPRSLAVGQLPGRIGALAGAVSGLSDDSRVHALGLAAPAITSAPMLAAEGLASFNAIKHLRSSGASGRQMWRSAKTLIPAFGTYATHTGLGVANAAVTQGLVGAGRTAFFGSETPSTGTP